MNKDDQLIGVVSTDSHPLLRQNDPASNILVTGYRFPTLLSTLEDRLHYRRRGDMETNLEFRQPIPYVLVEALDTKHFLVMTRMSGQGEQRLHGRNYLGIGGHVDNNESIIDAFKRELLEEVGPLAFKASIGGIIITNAEAVDRVHVGVFCHVIVPAEFTPTLGEAHLHNFRWENLTTIQSNINSFELWSQVVIRNYLPPFEQ